MVGRYQSSTKSGTLSASLTRSVVHVVIKSHKAHAKRPGRRSQKNAKTIDQQCARRIADTYIINTIHGLFHGGQPRGFTGNNTQDFGTGESNKQEPRIVEEGSGTRYYNWSFCDPKDDNQVLHKVGFHTQRKGILHSSFCRVTVRNLIWSSVARAASTAVQSTTTMMLTTTVVRHSYPFAVILSTEA